MFIIAIIAPPAKRGGHTQAFIRQLGAPIVVKASGLAAGKGVVVALDEAQALQAVDDMMVKKIFGDAGELCTRHLAACIILSSTSHSRHLGACRAMSARCQSYV